MSDRTCVFCQIVEGNLDADMVLDDGAVMAFLDRSPLFVGHVLVIPRVHVETIVDAPAALLAALFAQVQRIAAVLPEVLGAEGSFVANNNVVSQSVPHLHVHVVPRRRGDGLRGFFWPRQKYAAGEAAGTARSLRDALQR